MTRRRSLGSEGRYSSGSETTIGIDTVVRGRIEGDEDLRIEGRAEGHIELRETLIVESSGIVEAEVHAREVVVSGTVVGDVFASEQLTLNPGGKILGNVQCPRFRMAEGSQLQGDVDTVGESEPGNATSEKTTASTSSSRNRSAGKSAGGRSSSAKSNGRSNNSRSASGEFESSAGAKSSGRSTRRGNARTAAGKDDDVTVVIKHAALQKGEEPEAKSAKTPARSRASAPKKKAKKVARARVPARGRRKVGAAR